MLSFMPIKPKFKEAMISNETKSLSERGPEQPPILGTPAGHQRLAILSDYYCQLRQELIILPLPQRLSHFSLGPPNQKVSKVALNSLKENLIKCWVTNPRYKMHKQNKTEKQPLSYCNIDIA